MSIQIETITSVGPDSIATTAPLAVVDQIRWQNAPTSGWTHIVRPNGHPAIVGCNPGFPAAGSSHTFTNVAVSKDGGTTWSPDETVTVTIPNCGGSVTDVFENTFALNGVATPLSSGGTLSVSLTPGLAVVNSSGDLRATTTQEDGNSVFQMGIAGATVTDIYVEVLSINNSPTDGFPGHEFLAGVFPVPTNVTPIGPNASSLTTTPPYQNNAAAGGVNADGYIFHWQGASIANVALAHSTSKPQASGTDGVTIGKITVVSNSGSTPAGSFNVSNITQSAPDEVTVTVESSISGSVCVGLNTEDCSNSVNQCQLVALTGACQTLTANTPTDFVISPVSPGSYYAHVVYDDPCQTAQDCIGPVSVDTDTPPVLITSSAVTVSNCFPNGSAVIRFGDDNTNPLTIGVFGWPHGHSQSGNDITLTWPQGAAPNTHTVQFVVNDGVNAPVTHPVAVTINGCPKITSPTSFNIDNCEERFIDLVATDPENDPLSMSVVSFGTQTGMPAGTVISNPSYGVTRLTFPTGTTAGTYTARFTVSDPHAGANILSVVQDFTVAISECQAENTPPNATSSATYAFSNCDAFTIVHTATDGDGDTLNLSAPVGTGQSGLPAGSGPFVQTGPNTLEITVPAGAAPGPYTYTFFMDDGEDPSSQNITVVITDCNAGNQPPFSTSPATYEFDNCAEHVIVHTADDPNAADTLALSALPIAPQSGLPAGSGPFVQTGPKTLQIPVPLGAAPGTYAYTFFMQDGVVTVAQPISVVINDCMNEKPTITSPATFVESNCAQSTVQLRAADDGTLTGTISTEVGQTGLPSGAVQTSVGNGGYDIAVPAAVAPGTYTFTYKVDDGESEPVVQAVQLVVLDCAESDLCNDAPVLTTLPASGNILICVDGVLAQLPLSLLQTAGPKGDPGEKGDPGDPGAKGDPGDKGDPGAAGVCPDCGDTGGCSDCESGGCDDMDDLDEAMVWSGTDMLKVQQADGTCVKKPAAGLCNALGLTE